MSWRRSRPSSPRCATRCPRAWCVKPVYERTDLVNKAVGTATRALIEGSLLVAVILFLFLGELRSALVVIVTLPLAMLIAFIGMEQFGLSANLMSLAGLAIGIGMMVDGAVVMVENAFRIMAERRSTASASTRPPRCWRRPRKSPIRSRSRS
jgi:cobalt-zinc-cadmium resistance protein CzcA